MRLHLYEQDRLVGEAETIKGRVRLLGSLKAWEGRHLEAPISGNTVTQDDGDVYLEALAMKFPAPYCRVALVEEGK